MSKENADKIISMNRELYEYKQKVIEQMLEVPDIIEALNSELDPSELIYKNIFPHGVITPMQDEAKCYITVEVTMPQVSTVNRFFKDVLLVINVICHNDLMQAPEYGIPRHDYLSAKICELLNGSTAFGFGEMQLVSNTENAFSERHSGRTMRFQAQEQAQSNLCR